MSDFKSILIAEDDADDRFLLQNAFEEQGFSEPLYFVENGAEVLDFLDNIFNQETNNLSVPNFILLDLNMPKKDGREVLKELKANPTYSTIPVVIFSTTGNSQEMKNCYQLGANAYITKPNNYSSLLDIVMQLRANWIN